MNNSKNVSDQNQAKILIVDDEESIQKLIKRTLDAEGYDTCLASDGEQAFELLTQFLFDIVITDIAMPKMDGLALTKTIIEYFPADVIVMTGQIGRYSYDQFMGAGACDFVQKPFTPDEISIRVKRVLREKQLREDLLQSHKELAKSQKLESLGQLASGIAHEINTPIQYIGDNATFVKETFQDLNECLQVFLELFEAGKKNAIDTVLIERVQSVVQTADIEYIQKEIPDAIDQTIEGVDRIQKIVKAMKTFAHPGKRVHVPTNLNECLQNTITISKNEWKYIADVLSDLDSSLPLVNCNPGEMSQVFLNLIVNASHAISDKLGKNSTNKGKIKIITKNLKDWVEIKISDTGTGIPHEIKSKIFNPFFTTKEIGKGTGQGLAITHSIIVDRHKGKIDAEVSETGGAMFSIKLPLNH